ncbi:hypothetical protein ABPG74_013485 [Tetrahymena malaccensis]
MEFEIEDFNYNFLEQEDQDKEKQEGKVIQHAGFQCRAANIIKNISEDYNFMIADDMFLWKDAFQLYYEQDSMGFCPLNKYRPPLATYIQKNHGYTVHEESYHGFTNPQEIECICKILESLQINKAYQVAQFVKEVIIPRQKKSFQVQQNILSKYLNDQNLINNILSKNFQRSLSMAHSFLVNLSENPEKILKYQIKKFCFESMSHKIYSNGGSLGFINLIQGNYSFIQQNYKNVMDYLMFYSRNIKLPEVLDQRGIIDLNIAFMTGQQELDINIVTVEGFTIMGKCKIFNYPLSEVELIDGFRVCDYLSVVEFSFNSKILEDLQQKRNEIDQKLLSGQLDYYPNVDSFYQEDKLGRLIGGYQFIKKFYPTQYSILKDKTNKQRNQQVDDKINQKIINQIEYKLKNQDLSNSLSIIQNLQNQSTQQFQNYEDNNLSHQQIPSQLDQFQSTQYDSDDMQRYYEQQNQHYQEQNLCNGYNNEINEFTQFQNQFHQEESYDRLNIFQSQDFFSN